MTDTPHWLIVISSPPYFDSRATAGIDAVLACGAFGQRVSVVLEGRGQALLCPDQTPPDTERNLYRQLASLPLYDVDTIHVAVTNEAEGHPASMPGIDDLTVAPIDSDAFARLIRSADHILNF